VAQALSFSRRQLIIALVIAGWLAILANVLIALTGVGIGTPTEVVPRGWAWVDQIVGFVWVGLLIALGGAWWLLRRSDRDGSPTAARLVLALAAVCLLYPFTFGLTVYSGLVGNVAIGVFAAWVAWKVHSLSGPAALLVLPVVGWLSVATAYVSLLIAANAG
jgi:tryptophan-rich sensory protein